jgi:hypothetical protein
VKARVSRFQQGSTTYTCRSCGKLTRETGAGESDFELCLRCDDAALMENSHLDGSHEQTPNPACAMCVGGAQ